MWDTFEELPCYCVIDTSARGLYFLSQDTMAPRSAVGHSMKHHSTHRIYTGTSAARCTIVLGPLRVPLQQEQALSSLFGYVCE